MSHHLAPFHIENFKGYCDGLNRVGIDQGFVLYTNHHASNNRPSARLLASKQLALAEAHIASPSEATFKRLVATGVLQDTEWDFETNSWQIIAFAGWETLHNAFAHLHHKSAEALEELVGVSEFPQ